jgi:hypothetical protein
VRVAQLRYRPTRRVGLVFADDMEALRAGVLAPHNRRRAKLNMVPILLWGPTTRALARRAVGATTSLLAGHAADLQPTSLPDASLGRATN